MNLFDLLNCSANLVWDKTWDVLRMVEDELLGSTRADKMALVYLMVVIGRGGGEEGERGGKEM